MYPYVMDGAVLPHSVACPLFRAGVSPGPDILELLQDGKTVYQADGDSTGILPPQPPGGPYSLKIGDQTFEDIYFGEVYLLAGQSNMQLPVARCLDPMPQRFHTMVNPLIREIRLDVSPSYDKNNMTWPGHSGWRHLQPDTLLAFSALGVAFAEARFGETGIPIGLISAAAGGTPIEAWMPHEDLQDAPDLLETFGKYQDTSTRQSLSREYQNRAGRWLREAKVKDTDLLTLSAAEKSRLPWQEAVPADLFFGTEYEEQPGVYWLRCRFELDAQQLRYFESEAERGSLRLDLGALVDADRSYLNGRKVGDTGYMYPPRRYPVKAGLLRAGTNEILIRLSVYRHTGGRIPGKFYGLVSREQNLDLDAYGSWHVLQTVKMKELPDPTFWDRMAGTCFYSYIQPIEGLPLTAVLWYQGESNDSNPEPYEERFKRLIRRYQAIFPGPLPFVYVQLAEYDDPVRQIPEGSWALIREAQKKALDLPHTAMVDSQGCGEWNDLHPQQKWILGERMAEQLKQVLAQRHDT